MRRGVKKKKKKLWCLVDTECVFVRLPGCHIKGFLCVGGSDRLYLTLQLLLCSKCPSVNAAHESHLAPDRGSLFSAERGSCVEKVFDCVWGGLCSAPCTYIQTYSEATTPPASLPPSLSVEGEERWIHWP